MYVATETVGEIGDQPGRGLFVLKKGSGSEL